MKSKFYMAATLTGVLVLVAVAVTISRGVGSLEAPPYRQKGSAKAKVEIMEFSGFQCPSCAAVAPLIKDLLENYKDDVKVIFRHRPFTSDERALDASRHAEAAGRQGKFWEYHDLLFKRQKEWSHADDAAPIFLEIARELNLDMARFEADRQSDVVAGLVARDIARADDLAVNSTPTVFINERRLVGKSQLERFARRFIELELNPGKE